MAKLTSSGRSALRDKQFALPGERKYPVHDRAHAINAKARATQQFRKGNLSAAQMKAIHAKAGSVLRRGK